MASAKSAWGIDIGNRALKAVKLVRDGDKLRVEDIEIVEHDQILTHAGDNREPMIQESLAHFAQRHSVKDGLVAAGVSGHASFARFIKLPPVEPKKIPEIVRFEAIQQIPFPLEEVEWSYQLFQVPDSPEVEVGIFAMRRELVNKHIAYFTQAGITVNLVQMNPLAVYNAMQHDQRLSGTTMIIDMGAEDTDLIIADGESVWMRNIAIGGNAFTDTLAKSFKLTFNKAEDLKRNAATSKYAKQIFQAMRPVFADLVAEIQRSIGFYATAHRDAKIKKVIALGGTFRLPTLQRYLNQNLQTEVERLDGLGGGAPTDGRLATALNENLMSMVSAYGLAIQALGGAKINSSLLPEQIRKAKVWKEKTKWFAAAAALVVAGTVGGPGARWYTLQADVDNSEVVNMHSTAEGLLKVAQKDDDDWTRLQNSGAADRQYIQNIATMAQYRDVWPRLINDIFGAVPQQSGSADQIKLIPRGQRKQIVLEEVLSRYEPRIDEVLKLPASSFHDLAEAPMGPGWRVASDMRRSEGGHSSVAPGPNSSPEIRGFLVTIHCTSPNAGKFSFVDSSLVRNVKTLSKLFAQGTNRPYYVARVEIVSARAVLEDALKMGRVNAARSAAMHGNNNNAAPVPGPDAGGEPAELKFDNPLADPVTGEDTTKTDWEFTILCAVALQPQSTIGGANGPTHQASGPANTATPRTLLSGGPGAP